MNNDENKPTAPENTNDTNSTVDTETETQASEEQASQQQNSAQSENETSTTSNDVELEKTWHNKNALKRGIAMLGYGFIAGFVRLGITLIAVFQFFSLLFAEKPNQPLVKFGQNLNTYLYQINQFLTVNSEMYPFPFAEWPDSAPKE